MDKEISITFRTEFSTSCELQSSSYVASQCSWSNAQDSEECELGAIRMQNLPQSLKIQIFAFRLLHFALLLVTLWLIVSKRMAERSDIRALEQCDEKMRPWFYFITGLVYVKYNLEIINFIIYYTLLTDLQERRSPMFLFKIASEAFFIMFVFTKICVYVFELMTHYCIAGHISYWNIIGESVILLLHIAVLALYWRIRTQFGRSRLLRKIFRVYYLNKEIKLK